MGSGMTFRRLGVVVVATAFTALVGINSASAAKTTSSMTTTQGAAAGTDAGAGTGSSGGMTKASVCESRADKRKLTGDQRDSYVKRCTAQVNKKHKTTASKTSAKSSSTMQGQGGASSTQ